ncbi:MAG: nucleoid occlusion factor SlmA [Pseudomonadota bacterium]|jgi:TetR/AcrR family transcriptional regulator
MATTKPGERKLQILQTLATMLESPKAEKITTAALAARLAVSEAALYRHFASKAQMFEGLIDFIESSVFSLINQINQHEESGLLQARTIVSMLLDFAEQNPGMTKVLIGDALVNEDERLQQRMNQFVERVDMALRQSWKLAAVQGMVPESDAAPRAGLLMAFVIGRWHRFAKTGFQQRPSEGAALQLALLLG